MATFEDQVFANLTKDVRFPVRHQAKQVVRSTAAGKLPGYTFDSITDFNSWLDEFIELNAYDEVNNIDENMLIKKSKEPLWGINLVKDAAGKVVALFKRLF